MKWACSTSLRLKGKNHSPVRSGFFIALFLWFSLIVFTFCRVKRICCCIMDLLGILESGWLTTIKEAQKAHQQGDLWGWYSVSFIFPRKMLNAAKSIWRQPRVRECWGWCWGIHWPPLGIQRSIIRGVSTLRTPSAHRPRPCLGSCFQNFNIFRWPTRLLWSVFSAVFANNY